jgi:hypothetical protein
MEEAVMSRYHGMSERDRLRLLLGATFDAECDHPERDSEDGEYFTSLLRTPSIRSAIDRAVKNYLLVRWRHRSAIVGDPRTVSLRNTCH